MSQKFLPKTLIGDSHGFYKTIEEIANSNAPVLYKYALEFEFSFDAAAHNSNLLEAINYDLGKFIDQHPGSTISYGSELCPLLQLDSLPRRYLTYKRFSIIHVEGIDYPLEKVDEGTRISTQDKKIIKVNHKSDLYKAERPHVTKLMEQDVELGYGIPVMLKFIENLKDE